MYNGGYAEILCTVRGNHPVTVDEFCSLVMSVGGAEIAAKMIRVSLTSVYRWMHGYGAPNPDQMRLLQGFVRRVT